LDERGHDPRGDFVEVYDDPEPALRIKVAAIEPLATSTWVIRAVVRPRDGRQNRCDVSEHRRSRDRQM
jgi:hypothetical protein